MTNAEKYIEVFGVEPDPASCPAIECSKCPVCDFNKVEYCAGSSYDWWNSEYKEQKHETN